MNNSNNRSNKKPLDLSARLDISALIVSILTGIATIFVAARTNHLSKELNQQNIFTGTLSDAVDHLADQNPVRRRLAVINLAESAENEEEVIQVVKAIIVTSRKDLESNQDVDSMLGDRKSELGILFQIASLNDQRVQLYKQALEDEEVQQLIELFLPLSSAAVPDDQIKSAPDPTTEQASSLRPEIEGADILMIPALTIELNSLMSNIYSNDRTTRRSATAILAQDRWRPYDKLLIDKLLQAYSLEPHNYFGIVNSLYILGKVSDGNIQKNADQINQLIDSARPLLSTQDKGTYLTPVVNKIIYNR